MPRRVALTAAAALLAAWVGLVEPRRVLLRRRTLRLDRWPPALDGFRVALVSDLHMGAPHTSERRLERIVARVNRAAPDLVLLLGDFLDSHAIGGSDVPPEPVAERLAHLRRAAFAVLGNHDWARDGREMARALSDVGIRVLENEAAPAGRDLWVAGVADASEREPDVERALADVPGEAAVLLLSHDPDVFPRVPERVALTVSGHTHGGQVDVPLLRRLVIPSRHGDRYARGHIREQGRDLYVTTGLGTSRLAIRFRATPEVALLRLRPRSTRRTRRAARRTPRRRWRARAAPRASGRGGSPSPERSAAAPPGGGPPPPGRAPT